MGFLGVFGIANDPDHQIFRPASPNAPRAASRFRLSMAAIFSRRTVIWYDNFQGQPANAGGKGGGKGGGGSSDRAMTYSCAIIMGICEGPITGIGQVWQTSADADPRWPISASPCSTGTTPQTVWSYLASTYPAQALTYPGVAYVCSANYNLGSSASVNNNNFEVHGILSGRASTDSTPIRRRSSTIS